MMFEFIQPGQQTDFITQFGEARRTCAPDSGALPRRRLTQVRKQKKCVFLLAMFPGI
jgi:hypothetical protein